MEDLDDVGSCHTREKSRIGMPARLQISQDNGVTWHLGSLCSERLPKSPSLPWLEQSNFSYMDFEVQELRSVTRE